MRVLDLFSGIGGFSLGLERAGMTTAAFCEIDPKARLVLQKHWPKVPVYENVETLTADRLAADGISVDVICGGFPCQDISLAGKGAGLAGDRSGLWFQFHRLIQEIRPSWVIIENVSALRSRGLEQVLGGLAALGYDAEWHCIPASAVGAPHQRDRIWIVAHTTSQPKPEPGYQAETVSDCGDARVVIGGSSARQFERNAASDVADPQCIRQSGSGQLGDASNPTQTSKGQTVDALDGGFRHVWAAEPNVGRVANGVPNRMDRLKQLGNAVVPQIPEMIGRAIMAAPT